MRRLALLLLLTLSLPLAAQLAEGDRLWSTRANGTAEAAIAAYQRAVAQSPNDVVARARLLRALRFKGAYLAKTSEEKKKVYGEAKAAGEQAIAVVEAQLAARGVTKNASEKDVAAALKSIPGGADVYLWDAVNWGEWALAYGKLAAARQGAADRIRRGATIAMLVDPNLEGGSPTRVLGRLHDQTPRIPFVTGWASSKEAVKFLEQSLKSDPESKLTMVFLAEALVSHDAKNRPRAIELLKKAVSTPVNPQFQVEEGAALEDAKKLLKLWSAAA